MSLFSPVLTEKDISWFHTRYTKLGKDECWPWNAYRMKSGHGQIRINYIAYYAYQIQYFLVNGPYDGKLIVRHSCDNGWCVNPTHLLLGTRTDNSNDKVVRGRQIKDSLLLSDEEVIGIHEMYANGKTQTHIARKYNLSQTFISRVVSGQRLRHQSVRLGMIPAI